MADTQKAQFLSQPEQGLPNPMRFADLYNNATKLNADFMRNEVGVDLDTSLPQGQDIIFKNYYTNICMAIANEELHYLQPTPSEIEEFLTHGFVNIDHGKLKGNAESKIETEQERKYIFVMAQARQLLFDMANGRTAMLRGEDKKWLVCDDTLALLFSLGLKDNGTLFL